jgi:hypothetical protein
MATARATAYDQLLRNERRLDAAVARMEDVTGRQPSNRELMDARDLSNRLTPLFESLELGPAPAPGPTTSYRTHRADLLTRLQAFCTDKNLAGANVHKMSRLDGVEPIINELEKSIVADAQRTANDPNQGSFRHPNRLREVKETDQSGRTWTVFKGPVSEFLRPFQYPARCVTALIDPRTGRKLA